MKHILAENLSRFKAKNLNEQDLDANNNGYPDETERTEYQTLAQQAKLPIDKDWRFGGEIIQFFDTIPALKKYRDPSATYDDPHFTIPLEDFKRIVGWTEQEVREIDDRLEDYEGYIMWSREDVEVGDGA